MGRYPLNCGDPIIKFILYSLYSWGDIYLIVVTPSVLENVRQRQQQRCQEMFDKISSQEIFLHLAGNSCHLIYNIMHSVCIITIHVIMVSVLKWHIIYLLFKKSKSIFLVEIVLCWDWSLSHVRHHPFSEIYICRKSYNWLKQEIFIFGFCCQEEQYIF